jgi:hypothetical protein
MERKLVNIISLEGPIDMENTARNVSSAAFFPAPSEQDIIKT